MSAKSSIELLKAQAVIARSWVMVQIERSKKLIEEKEIHETSLEFKDELIKWYDRKSINYLTFVLMTIVRDFRA